ncbi:S1C family serine protease [Steroidobacter sp.]|uniref:S1C family serine protease n=1 Tax=Steroidobacter sp. TaxID=1978227 RepID=UPI001A50729C|nr:trypsin-like peptidase domain-containing protein [Steroidobacter sp.]MBL8268620.1 trypsin-like peptidase domain-containing protein [Steroidobacter sp.]
MPSLSQTLLFLLKWTLVGLAIAAVLLLVRPAQTGPSAAPTQQDSPATPVSFTPREGGVRTSFADAVGRAGPAVVNIYTARVVASSPNAGNPLLRQNPAQVRQRVEGSLGSGVILDADGHLVTNHHVIQGADQIRVQLADGRVATPTIVGTDPDTDLAVLRVALENPPVMPMGRSNVLRAGDVVLAIGNPFGLSQTVTQGIVSATGRGRLGVTDFEDFIQTDAAINFGNSGGALINTEGELIGINTAVLAQTLGTDGISFAIPVNMVRGVMDQIIAHGRVRRGWLGVSSEELPRATAAAAGIDPPVALRISSVDPHGPAAKAGIRVDDFVTHFNGQQIVNAQEALNRVAAMAPGAVLNIRGRRGREELNLEATLDERPPRGSR